MATISADPPDRPLRSPSLHSPHHKEDQPQPLPIELQVRPGLGSEDLYHFQPLQQLPNSFFHDGRLLQSTAGCFGPLQ